VAAVSSIHYQVISCHESAKPSFMHEFSLAIEVINLAQREVERNMAEKIQEMTIEVGYLSGVEADAFESALELLVKESILENANINIIRTSGKGKCNTCDYEFEMKYRMATCPKCKCFPSEIIGGEEFRVVSLVVE
jgi:hydrogenase nickel incorporation protein HypA/HybF